MPLEHDQLPEMVRSGLFFSKSSGLEKGGFL